MPSLSDAFGSLTGGTQQRYLDQANRQATGFLQQGQRDAEGHLRTGYGEAQGYLTPYGDQGRRANALYSQAIGLDGAGARRNFLSQYAGADPFRQFNDDQASRSLSRRYAAMGMGGSGAMALGLGRAQLERGSQDYENYLNRLAGAAGQGQGIAGQQAQLASGHGGQMAGLAGGFAQQHAGNAINYANARAQNAGVLMNNLMGLGGLAISAYTGMPVGGMRGAGSSGMASRPPAIQRGVNYAGYENEI
jgi:hypothetical protein